MIAVRTNLDLAGVCECTFTVYKMAKFSKMKRTLRWMREEISFLLSINKSIFR